MFPVGQGCFVLQPQNKTPESNGQDFCKLIDHFRYPADEGSQKHKIESLSVEAETESTTDEVAEVKELGIKLMQSKKYARFSVSIAKFFKGCTTRKVFIQKLKSVWIALKDFGGEHPIVLFFVILLALANVGFNWGHWLYLIVSTIFGGTGICGVIALCKNKGWLDRKVEELKAD